jgi:hypothetical protein
MLPKASLHPLPALLLLHFSAPFVTAGCTFVNSYDEVVSDNAATGGVNAGSGGSDVTGGGGQNMGSGGTDVGSGGTAGTGGDCATVFYRDGDSDGYGVDGDTVTGCARPAGYADRAGDCNDALKPINPGAVERCNGIDDNCQGVDSGDACATDCKGGRLENTRNVMYCGHAQAFTAAQAICQAHGMSLARVNTAIQNQAIQDAMRINYGADAAYWLGGSDTGQEGTWAWRDGTPFWSGGPDPAGMPVASRYSNWFPIAEQPAIDPAYLDCLSVPSIAKWQAADCDVPQFFVCAD